MSRTTFPSILALLLIGAGLTSFAPAQQEQRLSQATMDSASAIGITLPATIPSDWRAIPTPKPAPPHASTMAPWPTIDWTEATPASQNVDKQKLIPAFRYASRHGSKAVLVIRNGYLIAEGYASGWNRYTEQTGYSIAKSFTSALYGMVIGDGTLSDESELVASYIPSWNDANHGVVEIKDLLSMHSGLHWDFFSDYVLMPASPNQNSFAVGQDMDTTPGATWVYNNMGVQVLSRTFQSATGMQPADYATTRLAGVIGMWNASWRTDQRGNTLTYQSVIANAREFAKFGYLFLRNGEWDGQQVVPQNWVSKSTQPSQSLNPFYGYLWWLNTGGLEMTDVPADAFYAAGLNERRIYVVPSKDLVVIRLGSGNSSWDDNAFLGQICAAAN
ncbi:MAG: serine hydrolase [Planctomycetes bacterium]|nr:serine hydrolase [Planctomycetota bacterium]